MRSSILQTFLVLCFAAVGCSAFAPAFSVQRSYRSAQQLHAQPPAATSTSLRMGLFDGISKAFANQDFKDQDLRVRASHILIKGDDPEVVVPKITSIMGEIGNQCQGDTSKLPQVFAQIARRDSQCPSAAQGGDLGVFSPKAMVAEFDEAVFGESPPPAGTLVGPVITDFGAHIIYITQRFDNRDQVEEKLARIDPDAQM